MTKKKYIIIVVVILFALLGGYLTQKKNQQYTMQTLNQTKNREQETNQTFTVADSSYAPQSPEAVTHPEIIREIQNGNTSLQRFVVKSANDGSIRELFEINQSHIAFEKITPQNWSPTNRFLFVYMDSPNKRVVLFMKTDGTFTKAQYWLHSTGLYPDMNVVNAKWIDETTLELQTTNVETHTKQNYVGNFDDDTGTVTPQ